MLDNPSIISTIKRREGTLCPMCEGKRDVHLISLDSDYLSTTFALCRGCRIKLMQKLKESV
jgi:hypothetical protein